MQVTDFTGTYDYEKAEALAEIAYMRELMQEGELTADQLPAYIERTRADGPHLHVELDGNKRGENETR